MPKPACAFFHMRFSFSSDSRLVATLAARLAIIIACNRGNAWRRTAWEDYRNVGGWIRVEKSLFNWEICKIYFYLSNSKIIPNQCACVWIYFLWFRNIHVTQFNFYHYISKEKFTKLWYTYTTLQLLQHYLKITDRKKKKTNLHLTKSLSISSNKQFPTIEPNLHLNNITTSISNKLIGNSENTKEISK